MLAAALLSIILVMGAVLLRQLRQMRLREERYRLLADNIADVIILLDRRGNLQFVSPSVKSALGLDGIKLLGTSCLDVVHPEDVEKVRMAAASLADDGLSKKVNFRCRRGDGEYSWMECNFRKADASADDEYRIVGALRDVTSRKRLEDELRSLNYRLNDLARHDPLTGLANRRTFDSFIKDALDSRSEVTVILADIDEFKLFNDTKGHPTGDVCLKEVAAKIKEATAGTHCLSARYGGEEFALVLPGIKEADAVLIAQVIRLSVKAMAIDHPASKRGIVSISLGIASRHLGTDTADDIIERADQALYAAKRAGRDRVVASEEIARQDISAIAS